MKITKKFNGFKLILDDQGSGNERTMLKTDNPVADYVINGYEIASADKIIDIGAHIGGFSIYAAVNGQAVFSYEPDTRNIAKLRENIKINNLKNVFYFEKAVNATGERVTFYFSQNSSENSLFETNKGLPHTEVEGITLKEIFEANSIEKCNFLKLDCEGAEYEILLSLPAEYYSKIDKIALEYHDHLYDKKSLKDLVYILSFNSFRISRVARGAWYTGILHAKKTNYKPFIYNFFSGLRT